MSDLPFFLLEKSVVATGLILENGSLVANFICLNYCNNNTYLLLLFFPLLFLSSILTVFSLCLLLDDYVPARAGCNRRSYGREFNL